MRRRIRLGNRVTHPPRQLVGKGNVFLPGQIDKTVGKIRVVGSQRGLDILLDDGAVVSQRRIELKVGKLSRIVLRRQNSAGVARVRP